LTDAELEDEIASILSFEVFEGDILGILAQIMELIKKERPFDHPSV
jgi:hypothetical protein